MLSTRFSMNAELLHWEGITEGDEDDVAQGDFGEFGAYQDPITGEILNQWVPTPVILDDEITLDVDESTFATIPCVARGIVDGGIRVAGTTERFGDTYENIDFVKMWVPASVVLSKRDRITNIRNVVGGVPIWRDEEFGSRPTVFNVNGVTPLFDAWNRHVENFVLLERSNGA